MGGMGLRERIEAFRFDDGAVADPFRARLARENGWSRRFADRAIREYHRFLLLAATAGHPVTPSDQVDQVWHLHLLDTSSYWDRFCGEVLGRPLHHRPSRGGPAEAARYDRAYRATLESYRRTFGEKPPADLWPDAARRFGPRAPRFRRVDVGRYRLVPRRATALARLATVAALATWMVVASG